MTLPDEDPDEDKTKFIYPENYKEIADMQLRILEEQYKAVINGTTHPTDTPIGVNCYFIWFLEELKKKNASLLPKPLDLVGDDDDDSKAPEKKKKKKAW